MLAELFQTDIFALFLVFSRIGAALMLLPGYGEPYVNPRFRLMLAIAISLVITPLALPYLPPMPGNFIHLLLLLLGEIIIGLFIGAVARFLLSTLQVAGMVIAYQAGLANAFIKDPVSQSQGALFGAFLTITGLLMIFTTDLHYMFIHALVDSYTLFTPGASLPFGEFSEVVSRVVSDSFSMSIRIAAPFLVMGLIFYLGLGLLGRLMPQVQVFFIILPVQVALGMFVLAFTFGAGLTLWISYFENVFSGFMVLE